MSPTVKDDLSGKEPSEAGTQETPPNIIFFLVDDLGWADVGYNGATYHLTPNIDAFSKKPWSSTTPIPCRPARPPVPVCLRACAPREPGSITWRTTGSPPNPCSRSSR